MQHYDVNAVESSLSFGGLIGALRNGFAANWTSPDRMHLEMNHNPDRIMLLMPSWTGDAERSYAGIKVATVHPENHLLNAPSIHALYYLMDGQTGAPLATMDATRITLWRTACASALASSYLSRTDSSIMTMVGSGNLAPYFIRAHMAVRPITKVHLWNHNIRNAQILADKLQAEGLPVTAHPDLVSAVEESDIISTATFSTTPLVFGKWLKPGAHVDGAGAFTAERRETDDEVVKRAKIYCDTKAGAMREGGDIAMPLKDGVIEESDVLGDLHDLTRGTVAGRQNESDITFFKSVGHALEDLAAAIVIHEKNS